MLKLVEVSLKSTQIAAPPDFYRNFSPSEQDTLPLRTLLARPT